MLKELLEQRQLPPILKMRDGSAVTVENWEFRRQELVDILAENIYGKLPAFLCSEQLGKGASVILIHF